MFGLDYVVRSSLVDNVSKLHGNLELAGDNMNGLACIVVLYNPDEDVINKIVSYTNYFEKIILVDNSRKDIGCLFNNKEIEYIPNMQNKGIAYALNEGMRKAIDEEFKWVMTLDQDSYVSNECICQLRKTIKSINDNNVALISANYEPEEYLPENGVEEIHFAITSGSVINALAYKKIGGFIDNMFIDAVDYEYCYRLVSKGYKLIRDNQALFSHMIGNPTYVKNIECRNYPAFRYYFITRNNLIVSKMYKNVLPESLKLRESVKKYVKSTWYEEDKIKKHIFMVIAKFDYYLWLLTHKYYCHINNYLK